MTDVEHEEQRVVVERLRRDARVLAERFRLPLSRLDAEKPRVKRRYGVCYEDGSIRIRLRHARTGRLLKYSALADTLCHELAHLRYFDHGPRFRTFYERILAYARRVGIYRPTPRHLLAAVVRSGPARAPTPARPPTGPIQLELFER